MNDIQREQVRQGYVFMLRVVDAWFTCVFLCYPHSLIDDQKGRMHAVVLNRVSSAFELE